MCGVGDWLLRLRQPSAIGVSASLLSPRFLPELDARNRRSRRVMEKLGMTRDAVHRSDEVEDGERVDSALYSVLRSEWTSTGGPLPPVTIPPNEWKTTERNDLPELTTPRLVLRPFRPGDVDDVFEYAKDPEWAEFLRDAAPQPYTRRNAEEFIAGRMMAPGSQFSWAIGLERAVVGGITLRVDSKHERGEIGYSVGESPLGVRPHGRGCPRRGRLGVCRTRTAQDFVRGRCP